MPDYTPVAMPGGTWTFTATTALAGGDLVEITGSNSVGKVATAASRAYIGVAGHDATIGARVTVTLGKIIHESVAEGTVAAGSQLVTSATANRQVKAQALSNTDVTATPTESTIEAATAAAEIAARGVIGTAITAATDNTLVRWAQR